MATAYKADGVTTRTTFPGSIGGAYSPLYVEVDQFTVGTALIDNDTIQFMDIPAGYSLLDLVVTGSTKLANAITFNVGDGTTEDCIIDGAARGITTGWGERMGGTNGGPLPAASAAAPITLTVEGSPTAAATGSVITVFATMAKVTG